MDLFSHAKSFIEKNFEKLNDGCDFFGYSLDEESMSSRVENISGSLKTIRKRNFTSPPQTVDIILELDLEYQAIGKFSDLIADGFLTEEDIAEDDDPNEEVEFDSEETNQVGIRVHFANNNPDPSKFEFGYYYNERSSSGEGDWEFFESSDLVC